MTKDIKFWIKTKWQKKALILFKLHSLRYCIIGLCELEIAVKPDFMYSKQLFLPAKYFASH